MKHIAPWRLTEGKARGTAILPADARTTISAEPGAHRTPAKRVRAVPISLGALGNAGTLDPSRPAPTRPQERRPRLTFTKKEADLMTSNTRSSNFVRAVLVLCACAAAISGTPALGASHLWRFNEIFTNADRTIMFVEMKECCGAPDETFLANKWIQSSATGEQYTFPINLPCTGCTANEHLLLATQGFADLPGAPTPDFIIQPDFFSTGPDTLTYWFYPAATWSYPANVVPTDGVHSYTRLGQVIVNSPTNFAGHSGSVIAPCAPADVAIDGAIDVNDLLAVINAWGPCPGGCAADFVPPGGNAQV